MCFQQEMGNSEVEKILEEKEEPRNDQELLKVSGWGGTSHHQQQPVKEMPQAK